jgi:hypothetical protein
VPVLTSRDNTIEIIIIIIIPLSLPLVRLIGAFELGYILSEAYGDFMLLILRDAKKILGVLE